MAGYDDDDFDFYGPTNTGGGLAGYGDGLPTVDDLAGDPWTHPVQRGDPPPAEFIPNHRPGEPQSLQFLAAAPPEAALLGQWNQAKALRLQKDDQYLSEVEEDYSAGEIDEPTYASMVRQIQASRQKLLQEKGQAEAAEKQKARKEMAEDNAMAQAMRGADLRYDAERFGERVVADVDPATGRVNRFFQPRPGEWAIIPGEAPADGAGGEAQAAPEVMTNYEPPQEPQLARQPDGSHRLTIFNGRERSETVFAPDATSRTGWRTVGRQDFDANGRPVQDEPQQQADALGLTPQVLRQFEAQADQLTRTMRPGVARDQARGAILGRLVGNHLAREQQDTAARARQEQDEREATRKERSARYFEYIKSLRAEAADFRKANPDKPLPAHLVNIPLTAQSMELEDWGRRHPDTTERSATAVVPGQAPAAPSAPSSTPSAPTPVLGAPVPPAGEAEAAQRKATTDSLMTLQNAAWEAGDRDAVEAAFLIRTAVEKWGNVKNVPEPYREELIRAKATLDRFTSRGK